MRPAWVTEDPFTDVQTEPGTTTPSRDVALGSRRFDRYLGDPISIPVKVEVRNVQAEWEEQELMQTEEKIFWNSSTE